MHRHRTPPALVAGLLLAVLAASVAGGWFIASSTSGDRPTAAAQPDPAEPPYDAGDPTDGPPAGVAPTVAPPPQARPATDAAGSPPASDATPAPAPGATTADPEPTPAAEPVPQTIPEPPPPPKPAPAPVPTPAPDPGPSLAPYEPPPAIGIAAEALPAEGRAWSMLTDARRAAPRGSRERADLDWIISFARAAAAPGRPEGRRATARRALRANAWWYARRGSPDERVIARDPDGVILTYKRGHGFMVNPVATIGRWRGLNELWSAPQLAESVLPMLAERAHDGREWAALEYFDVPGDSSAVRPGVSGMGQARAVSLFAKAWSETRDPRFLAAAERVLRSFQVPVDEGGVRARVPDPGGGASGAWFPERAYPGRPAWTGAALNGFMVTLIELRRAAAALQGGSSSPGDAVASTTAPAGAGAPPPASTTPDGTTTVPDDGAGAAAPAATPDASGTAALATTLADQGVRSLVRFLPAHDSGDWSYYGLLTPGKPWRSYLADLNYHCYHVSLLRTLDRLYPADGLARTADRWQGYVDARAAQCPAR
jgi:hypothetical protein